MAPRARLLLPFPGEINNTKKRKKKRKSKLKKNPSSISRFVCLGLIGYGSNLFCSFIKRTSSKDDMASFSKLTVCWQQLSKIQKPVIFDLKASFFCNLMMHHVWNYPHFKYRKRCNTMLNDQFSQRNILSSWNVHVCPRLGCLLSPAWLIRSCSKAPSVNRIFLNREFTSPQLHGYFRRI